MPLVYSNPKLFPKPLTRMRSSRTSTSCPPREPRSAPAPLARELAGRRLLEPGSLTRSASRPGLHRLHLRRLPVGPDAAVRTRSRRITSSASAKQRYKLAEYYDADGKVPDQWEMYDLGSDPLERVNLAYAGHTRSPEHERQYRRLRRKLARVERTRLQPLA